MLHVHGEQQTSQDGSESNYDGTKEFEGMFLSEIDVSHDGRYQNKIGGHGEWKDEKTQRITRHGLAEYVRNN